MKITYTPPAPTKGTMTLENVPVEVVEIICALLGACNGIHYALNEVYDALVVELYNQYGQHPVLRYEGIITPLDFYNGKLSIEYVTYNPEM